MTALTIIPAILRGPVRPAWAICSDRQADLSDIWVECCDPENEDGAQATGFFTASDVDAWGARHEACTATGFTLDGIAVETVHGTTYHDRAALILLWGMDAIWRAESAEMEVLSDG